MHFADEIANFGEIAAKDEVARRSPVESTSRSPKPRDRRRQVLVHKNENFLDESGKCREPILMDMSRAGARDRGRVAFQVSAEIGQGPSEQFGQPRPWFVPRLLGSRQGNRGSRRVGCEDDWRPLYRGWNVRDIARRDIC